MIPTLAVTSAATGMTMLAALVVVGPVAAWWLARRRRVAAVLAACAALPILVLTMSPTPRAMTFGCAIEWGTRLTAPEPLANVVLFVPFALALAVATRRPVRAALAGSALSAVIEVVQAVWTSLGRSCDSSDWVANSAGAVVGGALAAIGMAFARWQERTRSRDATRASLEGAPSGHRSRR